LCETHNHCRKLHQDLLGYIYSSNAEIVFDIQDNFNNPLGTLLSIAPFFEAIRNIHGDYRKRVWGVLIADCLFQGIDAIFISITCQEKKMVLLCKMPYA
jgi:hypothetical protein